MSGLPPSPSPDGFFTHLLGFLQTPEKALSASLVLAFLAGIGWLIAHVITGRSDIKRQKLIWHVEHLQRQLEQLYGPLGSLITEGRTSFALLCKQLRREYVFDENDRIPEEDFKTWIFWAETDFMPRNREIRNLIATKAHLIDGDMLPPSYKTFLSHYSSWEIAHRRWKEQEVPYSWHADTNWPTQFETDVQQTFEKLKMMHSKLLGQLV